MRVSGPATLCADVRIAPHADHRQLVVVWDYTETVFPDIDSGWPTAPMLQLPASRDGTIGSSRKSLDGAHDRWRQVLMRELAGGT